MVLRLSRLQTAEPAWIEVGINGSAARTGGRVKFNEVVAAPVFVGLIVAAGYKRSSPAVGTATGHPATALAAMKLSDMVNRNEALTRFPVAVMLPASKRSLNSFASR
jgi:hypothetical protein